MSEGARHSFEQIRSHLTQLPDEVATDALNQFAAWMEGFAEGFAAGQAHAQKRPA